MSGKHGHKPFEGHMHDYMAHIKAVEEDLEYYRAKRFEPRIIYLMRRGVITFYDLLKVRATLKKKDHFFKIGKPQGKNIEARVRYLEEWLDEYVKGIALVSARAVEGMDMVTEDNRKERGRLRRFFQNQEEGTPWTARRTHGESPAGFDRLSRVARCLRSGIDQTRLGDASGAGTALETIA